MSITSVAAFGKLSRTDPAAAREQLAATLNTSTADLAATDVTSLKALVQLTGDAFTTAVQAHKAELTKLLAISKVRGVAHRLPVLVGTLSVERGARSTVGDQGYRDWPDLKITLTTADGRQFALDSDHDAANDIYTYVPGTDVMAFADKTVSVRGWLDDTGSRVRVTEFAPGTPKDFVMGRVAVAADKVFVAVRGADRVEVTDAQLKAQLIGHDHLGVVLVGNVTATNVAGRTTARMTSSQADYWLLTKVKAAPVAAGNGMVTAPIEAGLSTTQAHITLPAGEQRNIEVGDRMYVFGHFDGDTLIAQQATGSAGSPWRVAAQARANPMKAAGA